MISARERQSIRMEVRIEQAKKDRICDSAQQIREYLTRRCRFSKTPEGALLVAVIVQAWIDTTSGDKNIRDDAIRFFSDGRGELVSDLAGYDGDIETLFNLHNVAARRAE